MNVTVQPVSSHLLNYLNSIADDDRLTVKKLLSGVYAKEVSKIASSLGISNARQILHHLATSLEIPLCKCGTPVKWHADARRYRQYCSKSCTATFTVEAKKAANLEKYGTEWHSQLEEWRTKVTNSSIERFGV